MLYVFSNIYLMNLIIYEFSNLYYVNLLLQTYIMLKLVHWILCRPKKNNFWYKN